MVRKGYKQTEVGEIPEDWGVVPLADAVSFLDGQRRPVKSSDRNKIQGIYPYYGASGIVDYVNDYLFDENLILLGEDGENILSRNLPLAFKVAGKIWVNNHAHVMRPKDDFDIGFLTEYLENKDYSLLNTGTAQPKLNKQNCMKINVVRPGKSEQRLIATALSDVDDLITSLDKLIVKKHAIKTATMQQLLTGKKRLPGFGGEWVEKKIYELFDYQNGTALEKYFNNEDGYRVISIGNYSENGKYIETPSFIKRQYKNCVKKYILNKNDLTMIMNDKTAVGNIIGRVLLIDEDEKYVFNQRTMRLKFKIEIDLYFIYELINSDFMHCEIVGLSKPGTQIYINTDDVLNLTLRIPIDKTEQTAIATVLSDMDAELSALEARRDKTKAIKQGMMQELLTGKTRLI